MGDSGVAHLMPFALRAELAGIYGDQAGLDELFRSVVAGLSVPRTDRESTAYQRDLIRVLATTLTDTVATENRLLREYAEIEPKLREIEALESAARVLRALERGEPVASGGNRPFDELTMPEAAEQILTEHAPLALHYRKITEKALARGFKGKRTDLHAPLDKIASSFRRMMGQRKDIFLPVGDGEYQINPDYLNKK